MEIKSNVPEKRKILFITDIDWDAPRDVALPPEVVVAIDSENSYLFDDIDGYTDEIGDYLTNTYGFCHFGFATHVELVD